jgi:hypothetical protein
VSGLSPLTVSFTHSEVITIPVLCAWEIEAAGARVKGVKFKLRHFLLIKHKWAMSWHGRQKNPLNVALALCRSVFLACGRIEETGYLMLTIWQPPEEIANRKTPNQSGQNTR